MRFRMGEATVSFSGDVRMEHRGGKLIQPVDQRKWDAMTFARQTTLLSDELYVRFSRPATRPAVAETSGAELFRNPPLGSPALIQATGDNVQVTDSQYTALCRLLVYQRDLDMAVMYGAKDKSPTQNAAVYYEDPSKGGMAHVEGWRVTVTRTKDGRIEAQAEGIRAGGR
jgi:hypothetical protein